MQLPFFFLYLLSLGAVVAACWPAQRLVKTFHFHFLASYFGFLVFNNVSGFLNLMLGELSMDLMKTISQQNMRPVYILFGLAVFPLLAVTYYFLWDFVAGILDQELSRVFRAVYVTIWIVLLTILLIRIRFAMQGRHLPWSNTLSMGSGLAIMIMPILALAYLAWRAKSKQQASEKKGLLLFALVSLVGHCLFFLTWSVFPTLKVTGLAVPAGLFLANIAPVLVLKSFLGRNYKPLLPNTFGGSAAKDFCQQYQLSNREAEILGLLLRGRSNKEMEKDLFISPHTIRNHVHNIYQKLEVSSRLQLMHLVRSWLDKRNL